MDNWLLHKYIGYVSPRLQKFKRKGPSLYNFRCILCGDSDLNKNKARGYIYEKKGSMLFHCHNCSATMSVPNFIKCIDQNIYNEMQMEKLMDMKSPEQIDYEQFVDKMKKPVFMKSGPLKGLKKVSQLSANHPVKMFVDSRKIPNPYHAKMFCCPNFKQYTNELVPDKFDKSSIERDETRLLIPFINEDKIVHAYQGRAIGKSTVKYITIVLNDSIPKLYGLDTLDRNKKIYVTEGPIDSMFIPNAVATAGGDLVSAISSLPKDKVVVVYDNEPRNKDTIKKLDKAILQGYNVVVWPENLEQKDINDMALSGLSPEFIKHIMDSNTHRDLAAKMALTKWSKL